MFLGGIKILDLTRLLPGALCSLILADLGAEVLKIEDTEGGDYMRYLPPFEDDKSVYFSILNRNKKSIRLNLKTTQGVRIFLKLVQLSDVVIEGFRPGVVDKLGIGYSTCSNINPQIVYCSITGFGQTSPYKDVPAHDINYVGYSGILELSGKKNDEPAILPIQIADVAGGSLNAVIGILSALYNREKTNKGCYVDISMTDCVIPFLSLVFAKYFADKILPAKGDELLTGKFISYNIYKTKDNKYFAVGALEPKFWISFCKTIEREDLIDKQFVEGCEFDKYYSEIQNIFGQKTQREWNEIFKNKDACCTPVLNIADVLENEHIIERNIIKKDEKTNKNYILTPIKFSNFKIDTISPAPNYGEHTKEILKKLGYKDDEIEKLQKEKII